MDFGPTGNAYIDAFMRANREAIAAALFAARQR